MLNIRYLIQNNINTATDIYNTSFRDERLKHDILNFDDDCGVELVINDIQHLDVFQLIVYPKEGLYVNQKFVFNVTVPDFFPNQPYKVHLITPVFHPNIDEAGHVCLNILREDWMPSIDLTQVACSLQFLFSQPNPYDPLNEEAATMYINDIESFRKRVSNKEI